MEKQSSRRIRNLVTQTVHRDITANEMECARKSMVARAGEKRSKFDKTAAPPAEP